jgi:hypothetical protein
MAEFCDCRTFLLFRKWCGAPVDWVTEGQY